ncbi:MAG: hypothetical protein ABIE74_12760 [Pseudomonadota bacterium]
MMTFKKLVYFVCAFAVFFTLANSAIAGNDKELIKIYDGYNVVAKAGDVDKMLGFRTSEMEKEIREQMKKPEDRDYFILIGRAQVPESYEVEHITWSKKGNEADLYLLCQLPAMKEIKRPRTKMEMMVSFKKESGKWKMDIIRPLGNPSEIKRPKNLTYNESDAKQDVTLASIAGRIVSLTFKPDHTLVMVRVMDEEIAVFLPPKETLIKAKVNFEELAPWKMRIFTGYPHKTDKLKFFATGDHPME